MRLAEKIKQYSVTLKTDFEASLDFLADDIVWRNPLPDHIPFGGEYLGKLEVIRYFQLMAETFELGYYMWDAFEFIETDSELVVVGFEKEGRVIPTGKIFDLHFVWIVKFDDEGKICYLCEHNDTAAIGDAFRL